jgi:heme oxygenase
MTLREATLEKHKIAEQMPFNKLMFDGELSVELYFEYLKVQHKIFEKIESIIELPSNFLRTGKIFHDMTELIVIMNNEKLMAINHDSEIARFYCEHLSKLDEESIWPHIYLNYFALLFGGQMMKSKVPGSGKMYDFENSQDIIKIIREKQKDEWADEVNLAYDYIIDIFKELDKKRIHV